MIGGAGREYCADVWSLDFVTVLGMLRPMAPMLSLPLQYGGS